MSALRYTKAILQFLGDTAARELAVEQSPSPSLQALLREDIWESWVSTLHVLQGTHSDVFLPGASTTSTRSEGEHVWLEFGRKLGLHPEQAPHTALNYRAQPDERTSKDWWRRSGCSWPYCFCARSRPEHPMRVCKGCYLAAYCSALCQGR